MKTRKSIIFIILLAVLAIVSGCQKKTNKNETSKENHTAIPNQVENQIDLATTSEENLPIWPEQKFAEKDYEGWKTYTNEKLGYRIKYPANWTTNACDEGCSSKEVIINPPDAESFTSYISIALENRNFLDARNSFLNPNFWEGKIYEEKPIIFSKQKAYLFINGPHKNSTGILINYNNKVYSLDTQKNQNLQVIQSLSSFEFID